MEKNKQGRGWSRPGADGFSALGNLVRGLPKKTSEGSPEGG